MKALEANDLSRRLNILLIAPLFPPIPGGGATHPFYLVRALGTVPRVRVHVIAPDPPLPKGDKHWFDPRRVVIHRVKLRQDLGKVPVAPFLERTLREYAEIVSGPGFAECESLVVHGQHWSGIFVAVHLKHRFGVPTVATIHKTPIGNALGETVRDTDASYCHFTWLATWPIDVFIAGSEFFQTELSRQMPNARVELICHGAPGPWLRGKATAPARRRVLERLGLNDDRDLILCPVRWDSRKRVGDFVTAAGRVLSELRDRPLKFLITAGVDEEDKKDLIRCAQRAGVVEHLLVMSLDFEDMPAVFKAASLVVYPTDREGLGISVLEAMSLGTPVVATNAEGIREIIAHEQEGYLYAAGETDHLAQAMVKLLRNPKHAAELAERALRRVQSAFNDTAMAARHLEVYRSLRGAELKRAGLSPP